MNMIVAQQSGKDCVDLFNLSLLLLVFSCAQATSGSGKLGTQIYTLEKETLSLKGGQKGQGK